MKNKENDLLRAVHHAARGVLRFNGVDAKRCNAYYAELVEAVGRVNDFDQSHDDDDY